MAKEFNIKELTEKYEILKELSNVHLVAPERFPVLFSETCLSKLDKQDIVAYLKTRPDFKSTWIGTFV